MSHITLHSNQSAVVADGAWTGDVLTLDGAGGDVGVAPLATFTGFNALARVIDSGFRDTMGHGAIAVDTGSTLITDGMLVRSATMTLSERFGANLVLGGVTRVVQGSTLTATLFRGYGTYTVNGVMAIDGSSSVHMDYVAVAGNGRFHLTGENASLGLGNVGIDNTVVLDGGMLGLADGMSFQGTITDSAPAVSRIGVCSSVDVYNAMSAVRETFNETSGILNLFDANGGMVANLKFAGSGDLYAAPTTGLATNYVAITSHPGGLPVTITH